VAGQGVAVDLVEGAKYIKMSADQRNPLGQFGYGCCLMGGQGVQKDVTEGAKYVKMAADQGNSLAESFYAFSLLMGDRIPQDLIEAARYMAQCGDPTNRFGAPDFGVSPEELNRLRDNPREMVDCFRRSADRGNVYGQFMLGLCLAVGIGVAQDETEGFKYVKMAADRGHAFVLWFFGKTLEGSREGANYLKLSADQGFVMSQIMYAEYLRNGKGVAKDDIEADRYEKMAAQSSGLTDWNEDFLVIRPAFLAVMAAEQCLPTGQRQNRPPV
jgi:TPR repeat protein